MSHLFPRHITMAAVLVAFALLLPRPTSAETWTSLTGSSTVEAKMVGLWNDSVVLQMSDGRRVTVALANLRSESRIQAKNLAKQQSQHRTGLVDELKAQAAESSAPAPNPIPKPPAPPAYVQPKAGATAVEQLILVDEQSRAGHVIAIFDALPPSYRKDIEELVKASVAKANPDTFKMLVTSLHSIGDVIVTKQRWVFSHPRFQAMPIDSVDTLKDITLLLAGLIRDGFDPTALDLAKIQSMPLRDLILERSNAMAPYIAALSDYAGGLNRPTYELASEKDGVAMVKIGVGQESVSFPYTQVEGFWILKQTADTWVDERTKAKQNIDDTPDGTLLSNPIIAMVPTMIAPVVGPLAGASDEKSFHASMETLFAQMAPAISQVSALAGIDNRGRGRGGAQNGNGDEGFMEMEMQMEMEMEQNMEEGMEMEMQMDMGSGQPAGTGGRSDANPNIGARLEEDMRKSGRQ